MNPGILSQMGAQPQQPQAPQQPPQDPTAAPQPPQAGEQAPGGEQLPPEDAYERILGAATEILYGKEGKFDNKSSNVILERIKSGQPSVEAPKIVDAIIAQIDSKHGEMLPDAAFAPAAQDILMMLLDAADTAGAKLEKKDVAQSVARLAQLLIKRYGAPEHMKQALAGAQK